MSQETTEDDGIETNRIEINKIEMNRTEYVSNIGRLAKDRNRWSAKKRKNRLFLF